MPNTKKISMEDMSISYLQAVCACAGYSMESVKHDNYGVDCHVVCSGVPDPASKKHCPSIDIQLKSSYSHVTIDDNGNLHYALEVKNYKPLIDNKRFTPLILVLLYMNENEVDWIDQNKNRLELRKCAYWINLKGQPDTNNKDEITIVIPSSQVLTPRALKNLMVLASNDAL